GGLEENFAGLEKNVAGREDNLAGLETNLAGVVPASPGSGASLSASRSSRPSTRAPTVQPAAPATISIGPTIASLNASSSSAGTQSSLWWRAPTVCTGYFEATSARTAKRVTKPAPVSGRFQRSVISRAQQPVEEPRSSSFGRDGPVSPPVPPPRCYGIASSGRTAIRTRRAPKSFGLGSSTGC